VLHMLICPNIGQTDLLLLIYHENDSI
jgi:hypothetical protein